MCIRDRWLTGLSLNFSSGRFDWQDRDPVDEARRSGRYELRMAGLTPYARWLSDDRNWKVWALAGYGVGEVQLTEDNVQGVQESDLDMTSGALGVRRELWDDEDIIAGGDTVLRAKAETSFARLDLEGNDKSGGSLHPLAVDTRRLRIGLEATHERELAAGGYIVPSLELGVLGDSRDGADSTAVETGLGLRYSAPGSGLAVEGRGHWLTWSSDGDGEWGVDLRMGYDRGEPYRGFSADLSTGYGVSGNSVGMSRVLDAGPLPPTGRFDPEARLDAEMRYGFPAAAGRGLLTPYAGYSVAGEDTGIRLGGRYKVGEQLTLNVEAERRESAGMAANAVWLGGRMSFGSGAYNDGMASQPLSPEPTVAPRDPAEARLQATAANPVVPDPGPAPAGGPWYRVQLGAFSTSTRAEAARQGVARSLSTLLAANGLALTVGGPGNDGLWRVYLADEFSDRSAADELCAAFRALAGDCYVARSASATD